MVSRQLWDIVLKSGQLGNKFWMTKAVSVMKLLFSLGQIQVFLAHWEEKCYAMEVVKCV